MFAKPSQLTLGKLTGFDFDQLDSLVQGSLPLQVLNDLTIAQRLAGSAVLHQPLFHQAGSFGDQPAAEHLFYALIDSLM